MTTFTGTSGDDVLRETSNHGDTLIGYSGNDTYYWTAASYHVAGWNTGDPYYVWIPGYDVDYRTTITESSNAGYDTAYLSISFSTLAIGPSEMANIERIWINQGITSSGRTYSLSLDDNSTIVYGSDANETFRGNGGNDVFDGGAGTDVSVYGGTVASHGIATFDGITYVLGGLDGLDALVNIEQLKFDGATIAPPISRSPLEYVASYDDLMAAFGADASSGLSHYLASGWLEGRQTTFDALAYIASYADLMDAFGANAAAGASHYIQWGRNEGRQPSFDGLRYIASYGDLIGAFGANASAGAAHYISFGRGEGRQASFDGLAYIASYADLINAFGTNAHAGADHYVRFGYAEGRQVTFDGLEYIASYADLIGAFGANADAGTLHYINYGRTEGRSEHFDSAQYLANYDDLENAFGTDLRAAAVHFIQYGYGEGRTDQPLLITGTAGDDLLTGTFANETLFGYGGNDTLDGGAGTDTAVFSGRIEEYRLLNYSAGTAIVDLVGSRDGLDRLANIESVRFESGGTTMIPSAVESFPVLAYISSYADLIAAFGANAEAGAAHYTNWGYAEGRGVTFDGLSYIASYGDLIGAFGTDSEAGASHYISYGRDEGRTVHFDAAQYLANYDDLKSAFGSDLQAATLHFIQYGYFEGRSAQVLLIQGTAGNDNLVGTFGNETLIGLAGNDALDGGAGTDTANYASATSAVTVNLATGLATGGAGSDTLVNIENVTGSAYSDSLTGNSAGNILDGGPGADSMAGGSGNDTYVVDNTGDVVTESLLAGTDTVLTTLATYSIASLGNVERITFQGAGNFSGTGNASSNVITGGSDDDQLDGGSGNDSLVGGAGDDWFDYNPLQREGNDTFVGGEGDDNFVIYGTDTILENSDEGNDSIWSEITYSLALLVNVENLYLIGNNTVSASGNALNNFLQGNTGINGLNGSRGNDTLDGGAGADVLTGGTGQDVFQISVKTSADQITDFSIADDTIQLAHSAFGALPFGAVGADNLRVGAGYTTAADADDHLIYDTTGGRLYYDADGSGAGSLAIQIATLTGAPAITVADLWVI